MQMKPLYNQPEYTISDSGILYGKRGKEMHPHTNSSGYLYTIVLMPDGTRHTCFIHRAVACTFLPCDWNGLVVNHKDGNKINNNVSNLEWVTQQENAQHSVRVLGNNLGSNNGNAKTVLMTNYMNIEKKFDSLISAAKFLIENKYTKATDYRVVQKGISRCICGVRKTYLGFYWSQYKK